MTLHFLPPAPDAYDAAVEDAIATCSGDLRGALKALIIMARPASGRPIRRTKTLRQ